MQTTEIRNIHPEDNNDMTYWINKWGVNTKTIYDAIIDTGSLNPLVIRQHLKEKGMLNNAFHQALSYLKNYFFSKRKQPERNKETFFRIA